jgi:hypothetical protein
MLADNGLLQKFNSEAKAHRVRGTFCNEAPIKSNAEFGSRNLAGYLKQAFARRGKFGEPNPRGSRKRIQLVR